MKLPTIVVQLYAVTSILIWTPALSAAEDHDGLDEITTINEADLKTLEHREKEAMTNSQIEKLIRKSNATIIKGYPGFWQLQYNDRIILVITDQAHNRMRIVTVVIEKEKLQEADLHILMEANFDRALDARYAVSGDHLWSAYIHPLKELSDDQFLDGLKQVSDLADNYGTTYASSDLSFGGGGEE